MQNGWDIIHIIHIIRSGKCLTLRMVLQRWEKGWHLGVSISWIMLNKRNSEQRPRFYQIKLTNVAYRSLLLSPKAQTPLLPHPWKHFPLTAPGTQQANTLTYIQFPVLQISLLTRKVSTREDLVLKKTKAAATRWQMLISYFTIAFILSQALGQMCPSNPCPAGIVQAEMGCWCLLLAKLPSGGLCWHQDWLYVIYKQQNPKGADFVLAFLLWIGILQEKKKKISFNLEGVHKSRMLHERGIDGLELWPRPVGSQGVAVKQESFPLSPVGCNWNDAECSYKTA